MAGRVALVTGAGSTHGIGFATARLLAQLGAAVGVAATTDRAHDRAAELAAGRADAVGVVADLTVEGEVEAAVERVTAALGPPVVLVNNAGMTSIAVPTLGVGAVAEGESAGLLHLSPTDWRAALARNLDSAYLVTRAVLPSMLAARWGRVVMVASVTGPVMAMRGEAAYAAAKAGMVGLARSLAVDHGGDGITANAVAPGWIATASQTEDEQRQGTSTPVGRSGRAGEVAAAVAFLCSPGASYVNGHCLVVDGGNHVAEERA